MRLAQKQDLAHITDLLARAYQNNPTVLRVVGNQRDSISRMKKLFHVSIADMIDIGGVFLTENNAGVAVIYPIENKPKRLISQLKILTQVTGVKRGLQALKREQLIKQIRPTSGFLHFWMLAVDPDKSGNETDKSEDKESVA